MPLFTGNHQIKLNVRVFQNRATGLETPGSACKNIIIRGNFV